METSTALPAAMPPVRLEFVYDYMSRRCVKRLYDKTSNSVTVGNDAIVEGSSADVVRIVQGDDQPVASGSTNSGDGWQNRYAESFHGRLRGELLNAEVFEGVREPKAWGASWRSDHNHRRPHSSLGHLAPAAFAAALERGDEAPLPSQTHPSIPPPPPRATGTRRVRGRAGGQYEEPTLIMTGTEIGAGHSQASHRSKGPP